MTLEQAMNRAGWTRSCRIDAMTQGDVQALAVLAAEVQRLRIALAAMDAAMAAAVRLKLQDKS